MWKLCKTFKKTEDILLQLIVGVQKLW